MRALILTESGHEAAVELDGAIAPEAIAFRITIARSDGTAGAVLDEHSSRIARRQPILRTQGDDTAAIYTEIPTDEMNRIPVVPSSASSTRTASRGTGSASTQAVMRDAIEREREWKRDLAAAIEEKKRGEGSAPLADSRAREHGDDDTSNRQDTNGGHDMANDTKNGTAINLKSEDRAAATRIALACSCSYTDARNALVECHGDAEAALVLMRQRVAARASLREPTPEPEKSTGGDLTGSPAMLPRNVIHFQGFHRANFLILGPDAGHTMGPEFDAATLACACAPQIKAALSMTGASGRVTFSWGQAQAPDRDPWRVTLDFHSASVVDSNLRDPELARFFAILASEWRFAAGVSVVPEIVS